MRRLTRWQFWLPGTMLAMVLLLAVQYAFGRLVRASFIRAGQTATAAKIDLAGARVSLAQVILHDLRITDRRDPPQSLLQADSCRLSLGPLALWHEQAVVDRGEVFGLRIGPPEEAGRAGDPAPGKTVCRVPASTPASWDNRLAELARDWLEHVERQFDHDLVDEFASVRLADELVARWPQQSAHLQRRLRQLTRRAAELEAAASEAQVNPLRHAELLDTLPDKVAALQSEFGKLAAEIEKLPDAVEVDRRAILAARLHDEQMLRDALAVDQIDQNALAAYLLQDELARPAGELIGWLRRARELMPAKAPTPGNGRRQSPDLRFQSLAVSGSAQINGQLLDLTGTITDLATDPARAGRPTVLRLMTGGDLPLDVAITIDRTHAVATDELSTECRNVLLPKLSLGQSDRLRLVLGPSAASAKIHVLVEGESLSGRVQIVQTQTHLTPTVDGALHQAGLTESLSQSLRDIGTVTMRLQLSGTLDQPRWALESDLGPAVAKAMDNALRQAVEARTQELRARSQRHVDQQLTQLDRQVADLQSALLPQLAGSARALDDLAQQSPARLSPEYVGRRLPAGSLFR